MVDDGAAGPSGRAGSGSAPPTQQQPGGRGAGPATTKVGESCGGGGSSGSSCSIACSRSTAISSRDSSSWHASPDASHARAHACMHACMRMRPCERTPAHTRTTGAVRAHPLTHPPTRTCRAGSCPQCQGGGRRRRTGVQKPGRGWQTRAGTMSSRTSSRLQGRRPSGRGAGGGAGAGEGWRRGSSSSAQWSRLEAARTSVSGGCAWVGGWVGQGSALECPAVLEA